MAAVEGGAALPALISQLTERQAERERLVAAIAAVEQVQRLAVVDTIDREWLREGIEQRLNGRRDPRDYALNLENAR